MGGKTMMKGLMKMKKNLSLLLAASMIFSLCGSVYAEDTAEDALIAVKEKITVPAELSEFETQKNDYNGEISYSFRSVSYTHLDVYKRQIHILRR